MDLYERDVLHNKKERSYDELLLHVERYLEQRRKDRNREKGAADGAAFPVAPKVTKKPGDCNVYFFTGRCPRRDTCPLNHYTTIADPGKKGKGKGKKGRKFFRPRRRKGKGKGKSKGRPYATTDNQYNPYDTIAFGAPIYDFDEGCNDGKR